MADSRESARDYLERCMKTTGLAASQLAKRAGLSPSTLTRFLNNSTEYTLSLTTIGRIAEATGIPYLGGVAPAGRIGRARVIGAVQGGAWRESVELAYDQQYDVPVPHDDRWPGAVRVALEVIGDSMDQVYPEGTILICVGTIENEIEPRDGQRVIVQRTDRFGLIEATVKELKIDDKGRKWLWPRSNNPVFHEPIAWDNGGGDGDVLVTAIVVGALRRE